MSVELNERRQQLLAGGGKDRVAKQHEAGKMTARERLGKLFDEGSFVETGVFAAGKAEASSVVTGYGTVNDRPVYAYAQDFTVKAGAVGKNAADKIVRVMELAAKTGDESRAEFANGKAVFFQNGTWEYSNLTDASAMGFSMDPAKLAMIPIYCGVEGEEKAGLACGTENCWAVNAKASEEDQKATLDFMKWVVTSDEGTKMMAEQFGPIPFKKAKESANVFFNNANHLMSEGNYTVTWAFNYTPNVESWRQGVVDALLAYSTGSGDWSGVETAFVDGWATQYQLQEG